MEVVGPMTSTDLTFDSACSTPYISAPSSPKRYDEFYFSAPASPTRGLAIYHDLHNLSINNTSRRGSSSKANSKSNDTHTTEDDDFEFDFSGHFGKASRTAEELFDGGKIRPLKSLPELQLGRDESPPKSSRSPITQGKKMFRDAFSTRHRKENDSSEVAIEKPCKGAEQERGRERETFSSSSNSLSRRGSRSLSPLRVSEPSWEPQQQQQKQQKQLNVEKPTSSNSKPFSSFTSSFSFSSLKGYRKWKLKDFLLFRSASEGRATDKDPLRKFAVLSKKNEDLVKNESFRSTDSSGSMRREPVSPHELHYTVNRAVSEELRKRTFLPYNQGLLGCLGFNPAVQGLGKGFNL